MKTIIVAGGAGFIGSNFVRTLLVETDWRVVVLDKLTYAGSLLNLRDAQDSPRYTFVRGDIGDRSAVDSVMKRWRPEAVVNFAAETHVDRSIDGPRNFLEANVVGIFELLEAVRDFWSHLDSPDRRRFRFLQVSTDEVYGSVEGTGRFHEGSPYAPNSPYAASKASADHFVRAYHETYGLPGILTNCSNNYGYYQFPEKLIPLTILNAVAGKKLPIFGDGQNVRDWLFVEEHCRALIAVLERGRIGAKYNVGGKNEHTNLEVVGEVCAALDELLPAQSNPALASREIRSYEELRTFVPDRPGHDRRYALDCSRIERELGWMPRMEFREGIRLTVRWYVANRNWCEAVQRGHDSGQRWGLSTNGGRDEG